MLWTDFLLLILYPLAMLIVGIFIGYKEGRRKETLRTLIFLNSLQRQMEIDFNAAKQNAPRDIQA